MWNTLLDGFGMMVWVVWRRLGRRNPLFFPVVGVVGNGIERRIEVRIVFHHPNWFVERKTIEESSWVIVCWSQTVFDERCEGFGNEWQWIASFLERGTMICRFVERRK